MKKKLFLVLFVALCVVTAQAQIDLKKVGGQIKKQTEQKTPEKKPAEPAKPQSQPTASPTPAADTKPAAIPETGKDVYVSVNTGSNRNDGSKEKPYKDLQKAVDESPEGAIIHVAQGNYLGKLDAGYITIKKYVSIVGGYTDDFSQRDPIKYRTTIQPGPEAGGTNANFGLFSIDVRTNINGKILIDGIIFDKGLMNRYVGLNATDDRFKAPEGVLSGHLNPPGKQIGQPSMGGPSTVSNQLLHGYLKGNLIVRNCVFLNGSHFAIQMGNVGGHFEVYNNVFLSNRMAACEIYSMTNKPGEATLDFHHNTVLFTWRRDWVPGDKDMGYGFRYMTRLDANVYNNIIGCSDFSALDRTRIDSDKTLEAQRKTSANHNLFFGNIEADLTLPSGGGKFMRIFAKQFEDVDQLAEADGNREMSEAEIKTLTKAIDAAYLKAFLNIEGSTSSTYNPNSSENLFRSAMGMNQRGTETNYVSMYGNLYPMDKAFDLFGALEGYGAQKIAQ